MYDCHKVDAKIPTTQHLMALVLKMVRSSEPPAPGIRRKACRSRHSTHCCLHIQALYASTMPARPHQSLDTQPTKTQYWKLKSLLCKSSLPLYIYFNIPNAFNNL